MQHIFLGITLMAIVALSEYHDYHEFWPTMLISIYGAEEQKNTVVRIYENTIEIQNNYTGFKRVFNITKRDAHDYGIHYECTDRNNQNETSIEVFHGGSIEDIRKIVIIQGDHPLILEKNFIL